jgi:hypothetical protein
MTNTRYPAITWPWVGVLLCLALLGQEYMLHAAGTNAPLTVYRIVLMAVGVTSVALVLLPPRRIAYFLAFFVCATLICFALYLQYIEGLEPCPLCIFQRICVIVMGVVFLVAGFHHPGRAGATVYALVQLLAAGVAAIAAAGPGPHLQHGTQLHAGHAALHRRPEKGVRGQRRMRGEGLGIPASLARGVDAGVFHRHDRHDFRADSARSVTRLGH